MVVRGDGGLLRGEQQGAAGVWTVDAPCAGLAEDEARGRVACGGGRGIMKEEEEEEECLPWSHVR